MIILLVFFALVAFSSARSPPEPLTLESHYETNFDVLAKEERELVSWKQGKTVPGWWSNRPEYYASAGELNDPGLISLGALGSAKRSLGGILSHHTRQVLWGVSFKNSLAHPLTSALFTTIGEQWRYGGYPFSETFICVDYSVMSYESYKKKAGWGVNGIHTEKWKFIPELNITSVVDEGNVPLQLNGNDNQRTFKVEINFDPPIEPGHVLQIRWGMGKKEEGASNCLAIRSFSLDPRGMPEKNSLNIVGWAFLSIGIAVMLFTGLYLFWRYPLPYFRGYTQIQDNDDDDESNHDETSRLAPHRQAFNGIMDETNDDRDRTRDYDFGTNRNNDNSQVSPNSEYSAGMNNFFPNSEFGPTKASLGVPSVYSLMSAMSGVKNLAEVDIEGLGTNKFADGSNLTEVFSFPESPNNLPNAAPDVSPSSGLSPSQSRPHEHDEYGYCMTCGQEKAL